ncbi:glycosyltransferase [Nocardioides sp.]|uniref:glycosyltransferase n=1 Tax=Nocardioides sp. TaxID=35761 RepID=UPI001A21DEE7|nr:glycosyltransferase [Nocardioides sp.]MBJ7356152.1 glycosyltransferase family 1 protein [Nocardioides sp.]
MRVLFSSTTGIGHVLPMVPLAHAFAGAGHEVLWATGAHVHPVLQEAAIPAVRCGPTGAELARLRDGVMGPAATLPPPERAAYVFPRMFGSAFAPPMAADLLPLARDWAPDLMVHEQGELASPLVGAVLGVPSLTHAFGGAVPAPMLTEAGERLAPMWAGHGLGVPPHAGCFEHPYLDICPASVQAVATGHISVVQPLRPATAHEAAPSLPPLVYVTMGTVQNRALDLGPLVRAVAGLPVEVLVAVGRDGDTDLGDQPANVRVEAWVDQPRVLATATAVVSHGGSGTFLGALAQGVPQLCLPQAADQFRNAEGGVATGAALALMPSQVTPEAVADAVASLLEDPVTRRNAERVAAEIAAMPAPAEAVFELVARYAG